MPNDRSAKFIVQSVARLAPWTLHLRDQDRLMRPTEIKLSAVGTQDAGSMFGEPVAIPVGDIRLLIYDETVARDFEPGRHFRLDFTPIDGE